MRRLANVMVTGGAGFIGSNFIRHLFSFADFTGIVVNVDKLTYVGNLENLVDIEKRFGGTRYFFIQADICDFKKIQDIFREYDIDTIIHFAAESHVDRSIFGPKDFIETNIVGTFTILEAARFAWQKRTDVLFHHVSTDEVYGSLEDIGSFNEASRYSPRSPYAASKASSDHLVRAYYYTYALPVTISNCSNNFGPFQFPEKMIPLMILNILEEKPLPIYGDGTNIRDWLYVEDHSRAIWVILNNGVEGETYNIGGQNEWRNIDIVNLLCEKISAIMHRHKDYYKQQIAFVKDRPGHDRRYSIDCAKIRRELGWEKLFSFDESMQLTIEWYMNNAAWVKHVRSGEYQEWIQQNYENR